METKIGIDIQWAAKLLQEGEVVAIPTETVYGLAGNALNTNAVLKIYEAKNRPQFNPLIIHVPSPEHFKLYVSEIYDTVYRLAEKFCPGPLTFLLPKKDIVPDLVTAGSTKVAIRVPSHPTTLGLLNQLDFPLAAPSANPFGYVSPVTAQHVYDGLKNKIPYILDGGTCNVGVESTIVGFENDKVIVYRLGGVSIESIEEVVGKKIELQLSHEKPDTPGQLKSHYATSTPLYTGKVDELIRRHKGERIAILSFDKIYTGIPAEQQFPLSLKGDLHEAAAHLFSVLRKLDELKADCILAELFPERGLGRAINDRLSRAQHNHKQ